MPTSILLTELNTAGIVYVAYTDIREAKKSFVNLQAVRKDWHVQFIGPRHFVLKIQPHNYQHTSVYEAQVDTTAFYHGPLQRFDTNTIGHLVKELLQSFGDLMSFDAGPSVYPKVSFRVQFFDTMAATIAVERLNGTTVAVSRSRSPCLLFTDVQAYTMTATYYVPDIKLPNPSPLAKDSGPLIIGNEDPYHDSALSHVNFTGGHGSFNVDASGSMSPFSYLGLSPNLSLSSLGPDHDEHYMISPIGSYSPGYSDTEFQRARYSTSPFSEYPGYGNHTTPWESIAPRVVGQARVVSPPYRARNGSLLQQQQVTSRPGARQHNDYASGHHNVVDVERIRKGLDVRTTVRFTQSFY